MIHPDEGTLQAWLDDELPSGQRAVVGGHLRECTGCRAELEALAAAFREVGAALPLLDVPAPVEAAHRRVAAKRARGSRVSLPWAAVFALFAATGLAAAVPGSPVRAWLRDALRDAPDGVVAADAPRATAAAPVVASAPAAGVAVSPEAGRLLVRITDAAPGLQLRVRVVRAGAAGVRASGAAARARFVTAAGRIEVHSPGAGEVEVDVPRDAREFALWVNGRMYLESDGDRLRVPGPAADTSGPDIRFEVPR